METAPWRQGVARTRDPAEPRPRQVSRPRQVAAVTPGADNTGRPEIELEVVLGRAAAVHVEALQVKTFGFGGQDASLVVTKS
jgi:hypothetical protein